MLRDTRYTVETYVNRNKTVYLISSVKERRDFVVNFLLPKPNVRYS